MKITKQYLKNLIREELAKVLKEQPRGRARRPYNPLDPTTRPTGVSPSVAAGQAGTAGPAAAIDLPTQHVTARKRKRMTTPGKVWKGPEMAVKGLGAATKFVQTTGALVGAAGFDQGLVDYMHQALPKFVTASSEASVATGKGPITVANPDLKYLMDKWPMFKRRITRYYRSTFNPVPSKVRSALIRGNRYWVYLRRQVAAAGQSRPGPEGANPLSMTGI